MRAWPGEHVGALTTMHKQLTCITVLLATALSVAVWLGCNDDVAGPYRPRHSAVTVAPDGTGDYVSIQAALNAVTHGDTILLTDGVFTGDGNRDLVVRPGVTLRSKSNDPQACVIDCQGTQQEPHTAFYFRHGAFFIKGLTVQGAYPVSGGGAVLCDSSASVTFENMVLRANRGTAVASISASTTFARCTFAGNFDGALAVQYDSHSVVNFCLFINNATSGGGAAINSEGSQISLTGVVFDQNSAAATGGAIRCAASGNVRSRLTLRGCVFVDNLASYHGGALHCDETDFFIEDCAFVGNVAGIMGGAFWCYNESGGDVSGSLFYANSASSGSAMNCGAASPYITKSIIAFNTVGAAVECDTLIGKTEPIFSCSDIFGNEGGDWTFCIGPQEGTNGNISSDPLFCDVTVGDFRLQPLSPCAPNGLCGLKGPFSAGCSSSLRSVARELGGSSQLRE